MIPYKNTYMLAHILEFPGSGNKLSNKLKLLTQNPTNNLLEISRDILYVTYSMKDIMAHIQMTRHNSWRSYESSFAIWFFLKMQRYHSEKYWINYLSRLTEAVQILMHRNRQYLHIMYNVALITMINFLNNFKILAQFLLAENWTNRNEGFQCPIFSFLIHLFKN